MSRLLLGPVVFGFLTLSSFGQDGTKEKVLFAEKFEDKLDKDWLWLREDPMAWKLENGSLVHRVLPGYLHAKSNNSRNVLLRPLPKSDKPLAVEVHVEGEPKVQFEHAGVVWYVDDDNYVSLFQEVLGGKVELQMVTEKAGKEGHVSRRRAQEKRGMDPAPDLGRQNRDAIQAGREGRMEDRRHKRHAVAAAGQSWRHVGRGAEGCRALCAVPRVSDCGSCQVNGVIVTVRRGPFQTDENDHRMQKPERSEISR